MSGGKRLRLPSAPSIDVSPVPLDGGSSRHSTVLDIVLDIVLDTGSGQRWTQNPCVPNDGAQVGAITAIFGG